MLYTYGVGKSRNWRDGEGIQSLQGNRLSAVSFCQNSFKGVQIAQLEVNWVRVNSDKKTYRFFFSNLLIETKERR